MITKILLSTIKFLYWLELEIILSMNESVEKDYNDMCKNKLHILNKQLDHHMFTRPILTIYRITFITYLKYTLTTTFINFIIIVCIVHKIT